MSMQRKSGFKRPYDPNAGQPISRQKALRTVNLIWDEYTWRMSSAAHQGPYKPTKNESGRNFLLREIYALGLHLLSNPPTDWGTKDILGKVRTHLTRPDKAGDVFHDLFMSVFDSDEGTISRQERHLMARELEYARRHEVPPELLCGFLYQSGPRTEISRKLAAGYVEPTFR